MYKYHCVTCGQEIKEKEMLVPLAYMALDGTTDGIKLRNRLYITKKQLLALISRVDRKTECQYLTMKELLEFAYTKLNRSELVNPAPSAKEAYETYRKTYAAAMEELREAGERKREGLRELTGEEEEDGDTALEDAWEKVQIPGFNEGQVRQLCENFPDGVCYCRMSLRKGYGFAFQLNRPGCLENITPSFICPHCLKEICDCAFETRQIMVGFAGFQKVGKSCLIMALSNYLLEHGGVLKIPNDDAEKLFLRQYRAYRAGLTLEKTFIVGNNLYNPSVLLDDILWSFVDIPGGAIFDDSKDHSFNPSKIIKDPKFQAILHCDTYILCTCGKDIADPVMRTKTMDIFSRFLQYVGISRAEDAGASDGQGADVRFPVILTLAQLDENTAVRNVRRADRVPYNMDQYRFKREYSVMMANNMRHVIDSLTSLCYVTPISTSAYGFQPYEYDKWEEEGRDPDEIFRAPEPRNLAAVFSWIQMITGIRPALINDEDEDKTMNLVELDRGQAHFDDDVSTAIAQLFCNPSEIDRDWYETMGGGLFNSVRRSKVRSRAKRLGMKPEEP